MFYVKSLQLKNKESVVEFHWVYLNLSYMHQLRLTVSSKIVRIPGEVMMQYLQTTYSGPRYLQPQWKSQALFWCLNAETLASSWLHPVNKTKTSGPYLSSLCMVLRNALYPGTV